MTAELDKMTMKEYNIVCVVSDKCGCGEIGRHARFRFWCREVCRFKSCQAHQKRTKINLRTSDSNCCNYLVRRLFFVLKQLLCCGFCNLARFGISTFGALFIQVNDREDNCKREQQNADDL